MASVFVSPFIAWSFFSLFGTIGITTDLIRLEVSKYFYDSEVAQMPATNTGIRLKIWDWGGIGGAGVPNDFYYLVYDDSDQIALPLASRSADWMVQAEEAAQNTGFYSVIHPESFTRDTQAYLKNISVTKLDGHFFLVIQTL
ncbi:conserved protein of unknown function [Rhodovastum atsumiense]|nr:conserved protein of unknown function [Rhodovastum atsumiense]